MKLHKRGWTAGRLWFTLAAIILAGILSRLIHSGWLFFDKYLGDALYAAMVYVLLRLAWQRQSPSRVAPAAMAAMAALEIFQLTLLAAHWLASPYLLVRLAARLLGTQFSFWDLLVYAVGIAGIYFADISQSI